MTDEAPEGASTEGASTERASTDAGTAAGSHGPLAVGVDVGGSGIKAAVVDIDDGRARLGAATCPDPDAIHAGPRQRLDRPARPSAGEGERAGAGDAGRGRTAGRGDRWGPDDGRQHRPRRGSTIRSPSGCRTLLKRRGRDRQRRRRGGHRRDAVRGRQRASPASSSSSPSGPASGRACSLTASWSRTPSSARWRSAVDPPSVAPHPSPGRGAGCRGRPGRRTSTSTSNGSRT